MYMNDEAVKAVYLFIGELNGYKRGTVDGKAQYGMDCHSSRKLPEANGNDLHEHIWLSRLYDELDNLAVHRMVKGTYEGFHWSVPIELDATALA